MRVVIGATLSERLPALVCEQSIRETTPRELEIVHTYELRGPTLAHVAPPSPSTLYRFWAPEVCRFRDRAIYLESDMLVLTDLGALWDMDMDDHAVLRGRDPSVLVLDCGLLTWDAWTIRNRIDQGSWGYAQTITTLAETARSDVGQLPDGWNDRELRDGVTKILHYSDPKTRPWMDRAAHPQAALWLATLQRAVDGGLVDEADAARHMVERAPCRVDVDTEMGETADARPPPARKGPADVTAEDERAR